MLKRGHLLILAMLIFLLRCASAADYYISPGGISAWAECTDISHNCSLDTANANAKAGDTIYLRGGVYNQYIKPVNSGTSDSNRITYLNYNDENATIYNTRYGIYIEDKSYISVRGIHFYYLEQFMFIIRSDHNTVSFCTFNLGRNVAQWTGSIIRDNSKYNKVSNCTFWNFGKTGPIADDNDGAMLDIGTIDSTTDSSFYNLVEGNHFYNCGHHCFAPWSKYAVFRNNYLHNEPWGAMHMGYRVSITHGRATGWNLFEGNRFAFADGSAVGLRSTNNIFRQNMFYNNSLGGLQIVGMSGGYTLPNYCLVYNNVFYKNGYGADYAPFSGGVYFADWDNVGPLQGNAFKNNIFFDNKGGAFTYDSDVPERISIMENNYEGDPGFVFDSGVEYTPLGEKPDFSLEPDSQCIDAGGSLTNITSESGTGTTFKVENPWYFYDGWTIPGEEGDLIQLEGQSAQARIIKVDYAAKEITVDNQLSWTKGQGISLAYAGAAPDIGAYEYEITTCETEDDCPDRVCNQKDCVDSTCTYIASDENAKCSGDCRVCSVGKCSLDYKQLCSAGQTCSLGLCVDDPNCISSQELASAIGIWRMSGNLTMSGIMDKIAKWKAGCGG
jgi:hypothetical protein